MDNSLKWYYYRQHLRAIQAHGGYFISNCQPQAIAPGCDRKDCPMRTLALPPEAHEEDYILECDPPGFLADLLKMMRATDKSRPVGDEIDDADNTL